MKIRIHVNKNEIRKGKDGWPWTIHTYKECIKAKKVFLAVSSTTEYLPTKKSNPKAFIVCDGFVRESSIDKGVYFIVDAFDE